MHAFVAHLRYDCREEQGKCVECAVAAHVNGHSCVRLPILQTGPEVVEFELFVLSAGLLIELKAANDSAAVRVTEKLGIIGKVMDLFHSDFTQTTCTLPD